MKPVSISRRRVRTATLSCAALVTLGLAAQVAPAVAEGADPTPYYFTRDELPTFDIPWELSRDPSLPTSMADLKSGEPTCAAPAPLTGTDDTSADGYTLPVRIKLTNGIMTAGYSPAADHWGQPVPFALTLQGLTGWVNARVQLPSMKILADTSDVTLCEPGPQVALGMTNNAPYPEFDWSPLDDPATWPPYAQPDGSAYNPPPATFVLNSFDPKSSDPGKRLEVIDMKVTKVTASIAGMAEDGSLEVQADLALDATLVRGDRNPDINLPVSISGTFSAAVKKPLVTPTANVPWDTGFPPGEHPSFLPTKTLTGATEGSTTTIGSNRFRLDTSRLSTLPAGQARSLATTIYGALYDYDKYGVTVISDEPWGDQYMAWSSDAGYGTGAFFDVDPGAADVSVDMTIDKLGLPKGPPSGYGFD